MKLRNAVQIAFFIFTVYTIWRLYMFLMHFEKGTGYVPRPQSIDAFLPIGSLMALKNWVINGYFDPVHPAGLVLFVAIMTSAVILRKGFCSWVCPIGVLSEFTGYAGVKILGKNFRISGKSDFTLRSIKYLFLFLFLFIVIVGMDRYAVSNFLMSPYWAVADVELLDFWLHPGTLTVIITGGIFIGSIFIKHLWCRYLCPYGALMGILAVLSPAKMSRNVDKCTECGKCDRICPSLIEVSKSENIISEECIACFECMNICPANSIQMRFFKPISQVKYVVLLLSIIFGAIFIAKITGHWDSALKYEDYARLIPLRGNFSH